MGGAYKGIELVGTSEESFDDAVRQAVKRAGETIRNLEWLEVCEQRAYISGGEIREFQVKVQVWFKLDAGASPS
jgi:flavin-binding protein dodecin